MTVPRGKTPKPVEQKRRLGNPGGRPLPDAASKLPALRVVDDDELPEPYRPLGSHGRALWDRILNAGSSWIAQSDLELVLILCETTDERSLLRPRVLSREASWRDRVALRNIERQLSTSLASLGFTPADRTRLGVGEIGVPVNELDRLRARRDQIGVSARRPNDPRSL